MIMSKVVAFLCSMAAMAAAAFIVPANAVASGSAVTPRGLPSIQPCAASGYGSPVRGTKRRPLATGDLTGDRRDDLLTLEYLSTAPNGWNPVAFVRGRRGTNGALLWSTPVDIAACEVAADLN